MTFIDDQMTIIANHVIDLPIPNQALDQRNIDDPCRLPFPATDNADLLWVDAQEGTQTLHPLIEQLPAVDENKRVPAAVCNKRCCDNGLAKGGRGGEHAVIVGDKSIKSPRL